jgi:hypothetical protein
MSTLLGAIVLSGVAIGELESPVGYPGEMRVLDMRFADPDVPYLDAEDLDSLRQLLIEQRNEKNEKNRARHQDPLRVQFYPQSDALFFADMVDDDLRFLQPTFSDARPDLHIVHRSRYVPPLVDEITHLQLQKYGFAASHWLRWPILRERDGTESWHVHSVESR